MVCKSETLSGSTETCLGGLRRRLLYILASFMTHGREEFRWGRMKRVTYSLGIGLGS